MTGSRMIALLLGIFALVSTGCLSEPKSESKKSKTGEAKVGVGKKGEGYGNNVPILKPAATFWKAKEKIAFDILIPKNMQLFEATNGRKPKSQEEFMSKIIQEGKVQLPELDEGLEYFYDVQKATLMVRNKKSSDSAQK